MPLSTQVVHSLRNRQAGLLRPQEQPPTTPAAVEADREELVLGRSSSAAPPSYATVPVRLVTNGFWPAAAGQVLGSCCPTVDVAGSTGTPAAAARFKRRGRRKGDASAGEQREGGSSVAAQLSQRNTRSIPCSGRPTEGGGSGNEVGVSAASVAREIAELFDSVSVALNTADPLQYNEVGGGTRQTGARITLLACSVAHRPSHTEQHAARTCSTRGRSPP